MTHDFAPDSRNQEPLKLSEEEKQFYYQLMNARMWLFDHWSLFERIFHHESNRLLVDSNPRFFGYLHSLLIRMLIVEIAGLREAPKTSKKNQSFTDWLIDPKFTDFKKS